MPTINVHLLPQLVAVDALSARTAVVIDVLRATTTITTALAAGATEVIPCLEIEEARRVHAKDSGNSRLGGERGGTAIEGFDFGNSPAEYTTERIGGRRLVFTTTNGTRAMNQCRDAGRILLASFVNLTAVAEALVEEEAIEIVCAGTDGRIGRDDALTAGALLMLLFQRRNPRGYELNDQAEMVLGDWWGASQGELVPETIAFHLRQSHGGRNLVELGMESDIGLAAQVDAHAVLPQLDITHWRVRLQA